MSFRALGSASSTRTLLSAALALKMSKWTAEFVAQSDLLAGRNRYATLFSSSALLSRHLDWHRVHRHTINPAGCPLESWYAGAAMATIKSSASASAPEIPQLDKSQGFAGRFLLEKGTGRDSLYSAIGTTPSKSRLDTYLAVGDDDNAISPEASRIDTNDSDSECEQPEDRSPGWKLRFLKRRAQSRRVFVSPSTRDGWACDSLVWPDAPQEYSPSTESPPPSPKHSLFTILLLWPPPLMLVPSSTCSTPTSASSPASESEPLLDSELDSDSDNGPFECRDKKKAGRYTSGGRVLDTDALTIDIQDSFMEHTKPRSPWEPPSFLECDRDCSKDCIPAIGESRLFKPPEAVDGMLRKLQRAEQTTRLAELALSEALLTHLLSLTVPEAESIYSLW